MSEKSEVLAVTPEGELKKTGLVQSAHQLNGGSISETLKDLDKMSAGINIAPMYMEFGTKGQKVRGVFMGYLKMDKRNSETGAIEELQAVAWMQKDGNIFQNAGTGLVSTFVSNNVDLYTPVEIEFTGTKKVPKGTMNVFAVRPLIAK